MDRAMRLQQPDRVPVMCQLALGHYFLHCDIPVIDIWHSSEGFGEALIQLQRRYNFDGILINLPGRDPAWRSRIRDIEKKEDADIIRWRNSWFTVCPRDDNPHVYRQDGTRNRVSISDIDPERLFYVEPHGLQGPTYPYSWGFPGQGSSSENAFPPWQFAALDYVIARVGKDVSVHGEIFSPFSQLMELLEHSHALMALLDDPEKCERCLEALTEGAIRLGCGQAAHGVDAILISSAFAGAGFISPSHYRRFVLPFEKKLIQGIKAAHDIPIYTHTCGSIDDRLELMEETGTNGIDTLDPPPLGNVELEDAKRRIGGRLFIKGNLDPVNTILKGTPQMVQDSAEKCIRAAAAGGGYILSSACSVPPHAPPENLEVLVDVAESFDRYL
jgi:hypothetical protein